MIPDASDRRLETLAAGGPPGPGDLVLLPETADLPVEWAVLGRDPARPGLLLIVPADTNPLAGSADVEVAAGAPSGPLTLRCAFGLWIDEPRLATARRTGVLAPEDVAAARQVWESRERGEPVGSLLAEEVDAETEYQDWMEDVLVPARAALAAPAIPLRRRPAFFGNPFALAASVLLAVSLGLAGGLLWQDQRIEDLAAERTRVAEELRREREKLSGELQHAEESHRRELAERERRETETRQRDRERIAELERRLESAGRPSGPLLNVPFVGLAPRDPVRGEIEKVILPPDVDFLFLLLSMTPPFPSYRLEVADKDTGRLVWKGEGLKASALNEVSLALPRSIFPPGDYRLRLYGLKDGRAEQAGEYDLRIAHP
jgi:hypothetical protein